MSPSLEEAAGELYAVEPGRFTAERTRLTGEARQAKDTETAKAIGELRRPTTSAWLINQLVRGEQGAGQEIERLDQLGQELREAQAALDAPLMRELTKERQQLVAALVKRADQVGAAADQKVSAAVRREVEDTLGASVADEQAARAVLSGRLTRALTYAGFGEVDVSDSTATPLSAVLPFKPRRSDSADKSTGSSDAAGKSTGSNGAAGKSTGSSGTGGKSGGAGGSTGKSGDSATKDADESSGGSQKESTQGRGAGNSKTGGGDDNAEPEDAASKPATRMKRSDSKLAEADTESGSREHTAKKSAEELRIEKQAARRAEAEELVAKAREELETAEESLRQKEQDLEDATSEQSDLQTRLNELQAEVVAVRRKLDAGDRRVSHAERDVSRQERQLKDVTKALTRAEAALDRLDPA